MNERSKHDVSSIEGGAISFQQRLEMKLKAEEERLKEAIAQRPSGLRLPHRGFRFRALRDVCVDVVASLRTLDSVSPFEVKPGVVTKEEVLRLDYEPPHAKSIQCSLVPERYDELEMSLSDQRQES